MNQIQIHNCEHLEFILNDILYSIKGCNQIKNFTQLIEEQNFDIYDDYCAPLCRQKSSLIESLKANGLHSDIRKLFEQECPECCI